MNVSPIRAGLPAPDLSLPARARGVTLVELLITMVIAAILVAYGVPAMQSFITTNQLATSANDLVAALNLARSEAVRTASTVGVCVNPTPAGGGTWTVAPIIAGPACDPTPGNTLRNGALSSPQLTLTVPTSPYPNIVSFDALGRLVTTGGAAPQAWFMVCRNGVAAAGGQSSSRAVLVAASGRIKVAPLDANGFPISSDGTSELTACS
jgi:type IV fimbrial biogenesis protein FimT